MSYESNNWMKWSFFMASKSMHACRTNANQVVLLGFNHYIPLTHNLCRKKKVYSLSKMLTDNAVK